MARYENAMVAHVWANQGADSGQSNNGQFYFEGKTLFSYGAHYVAGYLLEKGVGLLNADDTSMTTKRHLLHASRALAYKGLSVPDLTGLSAVLDNKYMDKAEIQAATVRHLENYAADMTESAIARILHYVGVRSPINRAAKMHAAAIKNRAKFIEKQKKQAAEQDLRLLQYLADSEPVLTQSARSLRRDLKELRGLRQKYGRKLSARRRARVSAHVKALALAADKTERAENIGYILKNWMQSAHVLQTSQACFDQAQDVREKERVINATLSAIATLRNLATLYRDNQKPLLSKLEKQAERLTNVRNALVVQVAELNRREELERLEKWLNGETVAGYFRDDSGGAYCRAENVERDDSGAIVSGTLRTSQHAQVPLTHAIRIFNMARACREKGQLFKPENAVRVGHFTLDGIDEKGNIRAGCHRINWTSAIEPLARKLDLYP